MHQRYTLYCQKYSLTCLDSHMNLSDIPFLIHRVQSDVGPPFAAITASTLLGRLSTRFRSVFMGLLDHSSRSICEVTHWCWSRRPGSQSALIHPKVFYGVEVRTLCRPVQFIHTRLFIHVFMDLALCTGAQSCWNRKGPSPNCSHKVWSMKFCVHENTWCLSHDALLCWWCVLAFRCKMHHE